MKKFHRNAELPACIFVALENQMNAAEVVHGHSLTKRLAQCTVGSQRQGKVLESFLILPGIMAGPAKVVQNGGFALQVLQERKGVERFQKIFNRLRCLPPLLII